MIESVYPNYFQKSRIFLFPLLGIPRGVSTIASTYISCNLFTEDQYMLLVTIDSSKIRDYTILKELLTSPKQKHFVRIVKNEKGEDVFIFNLAVYKKDIEFFLKGQYSKISETTKKIIMSYYKDGSPRIEYIRSFLYPHEYHKEYATLLNVDLSLIAEINELCSPPNFEKENYNNNLIE